MMTTIWSAGYILVRFNHRILGQIFRLTAGNDDFRMKLVFFTLSLSIKGSKSALLIIA